MFFPVLKQKFPSSYLINTIFEILNEKILVKTTNIIFHMAISNDKKNSPRNLPKTLTKKLEFLPKLSKFYQNFRNFTKTFEISTKISKFIKNFQINKKFRNFTKNFQIPKKFPNS